MDREPFTWESYNGSRTLKNALIGSAIGAGVGYLAYQAKLSEEAKHPYNSDEYLLACRYFFYSEEPINY